MPGTASGAAFVTGGWRRACCRYADGFQGKGDGVKRSDGMVTCAEVFGNAIDREVGQVGHEDHPFGQQV